MIRCPVGTQLQSILFKHEQWTLKNARAWLRAHSKRYGKVDVTPNYLRFRQRNPSHFDSDSLRTITLSRNLGIRAIVGCPRR